MIIDITNMLYYKNRQNILFRGFSERGCLLCEPFGVHHTNKLKIIK
jgi:hypothetical protein